MKTDINVFQVLSQAAKFLILPESVALLTIDKVGKLFSEFSSRVIEKPDFPTDPKIRAV